jgi:hypothetical protein
MELDFSAQGSAEGQMNPEYQKYIDELPKDQRDQLSDQDKVAMAAFSSASAAIMGPVGPLLVSWFFKGGAAWVQNAMYKAVPSGLRAYGKFDWVSYVIEPVKDEVLKAHAAIIKAQEHSYRLLLEQKGLVRFDQRTPDELLWKNFAKKIKRYDRATEYGPTWGPALDRFSGYTLNLAHRKYGFDKYRNVMLTSSPRRVFAHFPTCEDCMEQQGGVINRCNYCVTLKGVSDRPNEGEPQAVGQALMTAWTTYRLRPLALGYQKALVYTGKALDAYKAEAEAARREYWGSRITDFAQRWATEKTEQQRQEAAQEAAQQRQEAAQEREAGQLRITTGLLLMAALAAGASAYLISRDS